MACRLLCSGRSPGRVRGVIAAIMAASGSRRVAECFSTASVPVPSGPQKCINAAYYRGGTSRAIMFKRQDLPKNREAWAPIFLGAIGSPDPDNGRQLDGMGGGISSLSKVCVVGPPTVEGADVDYTFAALGVRDSIVDYSSNCGNMSAAIGPFAVDSGLVTVPSQLVFRIVARDSGIPDRVSGANEPEDGVRLIGAAEDDVNFTVRIHNTNTGKIIAATFPLAPCPESDSGVEAAASGSYAIDGVAGTGAPVRLDFLHPAGSRTGKLLPTGRVVDKIEIPPEDAVNGGNGRAVRATLIDVGNPCCLVAAAEVGVQDGTMGSAAIDADEALKRRLEALRRRAAIMMGLADTLDKVPSSVPKIGFVSRPSSPRGSNEAVVIRAMSVGQPHKAVPVTVALALAAAARLPGSVVAECVARQEDSSNTSGNGDDGGLVVHHASGTLTVGAKFDKQGYLEHATVYRTARRLMEGKVYWK